MSSASELFYNRRSRTSRGAERGLGHDGISSDRERHSLRRSFTRNRRIHLAGSDDMDFSRQPRALLRSEHEPPQLITNSLGESGMGNSINSNSVASNRVNRLSSTSNGQLPTAVLQARARLLERLRGISIQQNGQEEVAFGFDWNDYWGEEEGSNSHNIGRTTGISQMGARREIGSPSSIILEELASIDALVDRIRSQLANTRNRSQHSIGRSPGLTRKAINTLLHEVFDEADHGGNVGVQCDCSVCLESFREGEVLLRLQCGHRFHYACLEPWLRTCADCPYCRAIIYEKLTTLNFWKRASRFWLSALASPASSRGKLMQSTASSLISASRFLDASGAIDHVLSLAARVLRRLPRSSRRCLPGLTRASFLITPIAPTGLLCVILLRSFHFIN